MANYKDVFLGGTCSGSKWRDELISKLNSDVTYFNPVIIDRQWSQKDEEIENRYKKTCKYMLFVITPRMNGFYSIAEVVDSSYKKPRKTIFCVLDTDGEKLFNDEQKKSLRAVERLLTSNKVIVKKSVDEVADFLNCKPKSACNIF